MTEDIEFVDASGVPVISISFITPSAEVEVSPVFAGKSAYDVAVMNGFVGTQQQWLESLRSDANIIESPVLDAEVVEDWDSA